MGGTIAQQHRHLAVISVCHQSNLPVWGDVREHLRIERRFNSAQDGPCLVVGQSFHQLGAIARMESPTDRLHRFRVVPFEKSADLVRCDCGGHL
jgi:hypothetical protein